MFLSVCREGKKGKKREKMKNERQSRDETEKRLPEVKQEIYYVY